jgi:urocanate hydratase
VPAGLSFSEARGLLTRDPVAYAAEVDHSLRMQFELIQIMAARGTRFWDYGNAFLKAIFVAGVTSVAANGVDTRDGFVYPSYVEHIMGPLCFDLGFGPFRWVCLSGDPEDLRRTDRAARECIDPARSPQDRDNWAWIRDAEKNRLVVGSQARILYSDAEGRVRIALRFNEMVRRGEVGPVIIGRDHHDVSGTDSPYRETANIYDGSRVTADMAHHSWAGDAVRGMTLVVLSNGGGVGVGKAVNGGFGLVLDGSERVASIIRSAVEWDVMGGIARRAWARSRPALETARAWNQANLERGQITLPHLVEEGLVERLLDSVPGRR